MVINNITDRRNLQLNKIRALLEKRHIYEQLSKWLIRFGKKKYGLSQEDAQEALHNALVKGLKKGDTLRDSNKAIPFLRKIGKHECYQVWENKIEREEHEIHKSSRFFNKSDQFSDGLEEYDEFLEQEQLFYDNEEGICYIISSEKALKQLEKTSPNCVRAFEFLIQEYSMNCSMEEIARALGKKDVRTASQFLYECRQKLKKLRKDDC